MKSLSRALAAANEQLSLEVIPFEPPKDGKVVSNYLVEYAIQGRKGLPRKGNFAVYVYETNDKRVYLVKEPYLEPELRAAVSRAFSTLTSWLAPSPLVEWDPVGYFIAEMESEGLMGARNAEELEAASHYLARDILGYWTLDPLLRDPEIEDISCEGVGRPVKVWHRKLNSSGWLETNITFSILWAASASRSAAASMGSVKVTPVDASW